MWLEVKAVLAVREESLVGEVLVAERLVQPMNLTPAVTTGPRLHL
jgi:hypothetical protein